MTDSPRFKRQRKDVHNLLLSRTQRPGEEWLSVTQIVAGTGHSPDTVCATISDLIQAGLVLANDVTRQYRARGTLATPGITHPKETPIATEPAPKQLACNRRHEDPADAAQRRAEYLRKEALDFAIKQDGGNNEPAYIVASAKTFESYLSTKAEPGILTLQQAVLIEKALEDAQATLGLIDSPDTSAAVRKALDVINVAILGAGE